MFYLLLFGGDKNLVDNLGQVQVLLFSEWDVCPDSYFVKYLNKKTLLNKKTIFGPERLFV